MYKFLCHQMIHVFKSFRHRYTLVCPTKGQQEPCATPRLGSPPHAMSNPDSPRKGSSTEGGQQEGDRAAFAGSPQLLPGPSSVLLSPLPISWDKTTSSLWRPVLPWKGRRRSSSLYNSSLKASVPFCLSRQNQMEEGGAELGASGPCL